MRDDLSGIYLVTRAQTGEQLAWDLLVERYAPLVWSICRRYRLSGPDTQDVGQNVWLRLAGQLDRIRDPAVLPGWLATTTSRECAKALRAARRPHAAGQTRQTRNIPDATAATAEQELEQELLLAERHAALREALADLPPDRQRLLALLTEDPPVPYDKISAELGIPVGSIGPDRGRCLDKLRRHPAIAAQINAAQANAEPGPHGKAAPQ